MSKHLITMIMPGLSSLGINCLKRSISKFTSRYSFPRQYVAGFHTTAACKEAAYLATADASVVARLKAAGAIVVGKTNLDQFATGLVGVRSPFGAVKNSFNPEYISGGSSSGSSVAVANGQVPFRFRHRYRRFRSCAGTTILSG